MSHGLTTTPNGRSLGVCVVWVGGSLLVFVEDNYILLMMVVYALNTLTLQPANVGQGVLTKFISYQAGLISSRQIPRQSVHPLHGVPSGSSIAPLGQAQTNLRLRRSPHSTQ